MDDDTLTLLLLVGAAIVGVKVLGAAAEALPAGVAAPGAPPLPVTPGANAGGTVGGNSFSFAQGTRASYGESSGQLSGQAVLNHRGGGGAFVLDVQARSSGPLGVGAVFGGRGATAWGRVQQVVFDVPPSADWQSGSVGFGGFLDRGLFNGVQVQLAVVGLGGEEYVRTVLTAELGF